MCLNLNGDSSFCPIHLRRELTKLYPGELPVSLNLVRPCLLLVGTGY